MNSIVKSQWEKKVLSRKRDLKFSQKKNTSRADIKRREHQNTIAREREKERRLMKSCLH